MPRNCAGSPGRTNPHPTLCATPLRPPLLGALSDAACNGDSHFLDSLGAGVSGDAVGARPGEIASGGPPARQHGPDGGDGSGGQQLHAGVAEPHLVLSPEPTKHLPAARPCRSERTEDGKTAQRHPPTAMSTIAPAATRWGQGRARCWCTLARCDRQASRSSTISRTVCQTASSSRRSADASKTAVQV